MSEKRMKQPVIPGLGIREEEVPYGKKKRSRRPKTRENPPEKLGKAVRLPTPDFSDPNRPLTCLEVDFPIAQINALSNLEGNAGKPIYQMSKWWARRRSSVFRAMLIAAATEAPADPSEAAKKVWDHYYCNHQKAGSFKKLRVLDCFMGGGTTLVEGSRLGMQMTGVDLNPVAWFEELNNPNFRIKKSTDDILKWYAEVERDSKVCGYAQTASKLVEHWRTHWQQVQAVQPTLFDFLEEKG